MSERSKDWLRQSERDLESAKSQWESGFFEWACFIAQQSAEKAVKAVYFYFGGEAWGHSVTQLLKGLEEKIDIPDELHKHAKFLDKFYIPARYPNGWSEGIPSDYITDEDVKNAINSAEKILRFCKNILDR